MRVLPDATKSLPCWKVRNEATRKQLYSVVSKNPLDGYSYAITHSAQGQRSALVRLDGQDNVLANATIASAQTGWVFTAAAFSLSGDLYLLRLSDDTLYLIGASDIADMFAFRGSVPFSNSWTLNGLVRPSTAVFSV